MAKIKIIEKVEKFWDDQPCNILHSNKKLGSIGYFDEVEEKKYFVEPHIKKFTEFPKWRNKNVLERAWLAITEKENLKTNISEK